MDSDYVNKILMAVLATCLALVAMNIAAGAVFSPRVPAKPGFEIAVQEKAPEQKGGQEEAPQPIDVRLASSSAERGQSAAKVCLACHSFDKGGPNKQGPNLWGVVGRQRDSEPGFKYSDAMMGKGGTWTLEELDKFIASPKGYIPGTAMTFTGIPQAAKRADVINYLHTLSDNPIALPKAAAK